MPEGSQKLPCLQVYTSLRPLTPDKDTYRRYVQLDMLPGVRFGFGAEVDWSSVCGSTTPPPATTLLAPRSLRTLAHVALQFAS